MEYVRTLVECRLRHPRKNIAGIHTYACAYFLWCQNVELVQLEESLLFECGQWENQYGNEWKYAQQKELFYKLWIINVNTHLSSVSFVFEFSLSLLQSRWKYCCVHVFRSPTLKTLSFSKRKATVNKCAVLSATICCCCLLMMLPTCEFFSILFIFVLCNVCFSLPSPIATHADRAHSVFFFNNIPLALITLKNQWGFQMPFLILVSTNSFSSNLAS